MHELLPQGSADRLRRAPLHLALDEVRVERLPDVLRDDVAEQLDLTRLLVDADMGEMRRGRGCDDRVGDGRVALDGRPRCVEGLAQLPGEVADGASGVW